jgi:hypothetical protein
MMPVMLEPGTPVALVVGVLLFVLLMALGLGTGWGTLTLLRFPAEPTRRWLLAPFAATVLWALASNLAVRLGLTLAQVAPGLVVVSLLLVVVGLASLRRSIRLRMVLLVLALGLVAGLFIWPYVVRGLTTHLGSGNLDTYHYTSVAASLWRYGLGTTPSLPFFQRYGPTASALGEARNHAFVLLGVMSPLVQAGEPLFVRNLFVGWSVFVLACNLAFYRLTWGGSEERPEPSSGQVLAYVVLTAGVGWALVPVLVGNWDNGLLVSVGPALAALAVEPVERPGHGLFLGATIAYAAYAYTELAPLLGLFLLPLYLGHLFTRSIRGRQLAASALAVASAAALLAPGVKPLWTYLAHQVRASRVTEGMKPGGAYAGGLVSRAGDPSAWWALGGEHGSAPADDWPVACAWLLTALVAIGVLRLARRRCWGEIGTLALMGASLVYYVGVQRYGYAGYKILSVTWWLIGRCLVEGASGTLAVARAGRHAGGWRRLPASAVALALGAALATCLFVADGHRRQYFFHEAIYRAQPTTAALARLRAGGAALPPLDVLVGPQINDYWTLPWLYYAFKDSALRVSHAAPIPVPGGIVWPKDGLVPQAFLQRAKEPPGAADHFRTPEFALVDLDSTAVVARIDNPNQIEAWGSWLGTQPITITLLAHRRVAVTLMFDATPGPSRPETPRRTLVLQAGTQELQRRVIEASTHITVPLVVDGGREELTLFTPDTPTVSMLANGDRRPLLVAVTNVRIGPGGSEQ